MYNRYIPQSDGSYHRRPVQSKTPNPPKPEPIHQNTPAPKPPDPPPAPPTQSSVPSFLRQLLPRNFDTGDLLIVLLMLLLAGEREDERSNALLTLALYFFM